MKDIFGRTIVPVIYKGFECYQVEATGEIGMIKDQVAKACGVHKTAINSIIKNTCPDRYSPHMTPFIGQNVELTRTSFLQKGAPKIILNWSYCAALIAYYEDKKERKIDRTGKNKSKLLPGEFRCLNADRVVEDGREYFVLENGDRGMSQRGLARACNVSHNAIYELLQHLSNRKYRDWAGNFTQENVILTRDVMKSGKPLMLLKIEFCNAAIAHFARSRQTKHYKKDVANNVLNFDLKL